MIEVTSRHMKCTHFNLDYSRMPAVALQEDMAVCGYEQECKLKAPFLSNHFLSILIHYRD